MICSFHFSRSGQILDGCSKAFLPFMLILKVFLPFMLPGDFNYVHIMKTVSDTVLKSLLRVLYCG